MAAYKLYWNSKFNIVYLRFGLFGRGSIGRASSESILTGLQLNGGINFINGGNDFVNDSIDFVNDRTDYINDGTDFINKRSNYMNERND